ncbi:hypothetical protein OX348_004436, partial [Salmonella enterica subsp. enterica serovar Infantis]|nr:hypothetical protein [Salmonella enterica subsp. enterica serovar Typhimurium]EKF0848209.1 hypothetical protein [Salmonella enterica subsp. enterica serovar Infantis]
ANAGGIPGVFTLNLEIQGKVIRVLDGDTIEVLQDKQDKKPVRIRLANIDAPEKKQAAVSEERAIRCANRLIQCKG